MTEHTEVAQPSQGWGACGEFIVLVPGLNHSILIECLVEVVVGMNFWASLAPSKHEMFLEGCRKKGTLALAL